MIFQHLIKALTALIAASLTVHISFFFSFVQGLWSPSTCSFLDGRRTPNGLDAQQTAENHAEEVFAESSSAIGILVGLRQNLDFKLKQCAKDIATELARSIPDMDNHCGKNYTVLISLAAKVSASLFLNISPAGKFHEVMVCVCFTIFDIDVFRFLV